MSVREHGAGTSGNQEIDEKLDSGYSVYAKPMYARYEVEASMNF